MAFPVRVRGPNGQATVSIDPAMSVDDLLIALSNAASVPKAGLSIRSGFPPKPLDIPTDRSANASSSLNLSRGETLVVASDAPAAAASGPDPAPSQSSTQAFSFGSASTPPQSSTSRSTGGSTSASRGADKIKNTSVPATAYGGSLVIRIAPDDNSCLFHALGLLLMPGDVSAPTILRSQVAERIRERPDDYSDAILGMPREKYIATIQKDSTWGGAIELAVLSSVHRCEIDAVDIQSSRIDRYGQGEYDNRALLLYSGIHYDSATCSPLPPDSLDMLDFDTRLFPTQDDDAILTCLTTLAAALREKRYYTDTANFTLKCEVCKKGLVGQKEAQAHAMATGHASFGEY